MKFSDFLNEAYVGAYKSVINESDLVEKIKLNCKKYLSDKSRKVIYRGMRGDEAYLCDTSTTKRKSANTSNVYTVILDDTLPNDFPRRSQSIICTTSYGYASSYADESDGNLFVILPCDNAKIGSTNESDVWRVKYDNGKHKLYDLSSLFPMNTKLESIEDFVVMIYKKYFSDIVELDKHKESPIYPFFEDAIKLYNTDGEIPDDISEKDFESLMIDVITKTIKKDMSAKALNFDVIPLNQTSKIHDINTEVWIGGKSIAVPISMWKKIKKNI